MPAKRKSVSTTHNVLDPREINSYLIHSDDFSFVDLWLSLVLQKRVFFFAVALCLILAVIHSTVLSRTYSYKTSISIGMQQGGEYIQSPDEVAEYFNNAILPKVLKQQHLAFPDNELDVSISIPKNTNFVLLSSKGTTHQKEAIVILHSQLVNALVKSHQNRVARTLSYLNDDLDNLNLRLSRLIKLSESDNNVLLSMQIIQLETNSRETKKNIIQFTNTHSEMGTLQSSKPTHNHLLFLTVSTIFSLFLGLLAAAFANFFVKVKEKRT